MPPLSEPRTISHQKINQALKASSRREARGRQRRETDRNTMHLGHRPHPAQFSALGPLFPLEGHSTHCAFAPKIPPSILVFRSGPTGLGCMSSCACWGFQKNF